MNKLLLCTLAFLIAAAAHADSAGLLQMIDYMGVDYSNAVAGGQVVSPGEYAEMQEFAANIRSGIEQLPQSGGSAKLADLARQLQTAVAGKADPDTITGITRGLRREVMQDYPVTLTPRRAPDLQQGQALYRQHCAACHGEDARGDGPMAAKLDPPPINFLDAKRARQRSVFGLYNTITLGVSGTSMTAFPGLSDAQRWDLAFYVGSRYPAPDTLRQGQAAWQPQELSLQDAVTRSPAELGESMPHGAAVAAWLRLHPGKLFNQAASPIDIAMDRLRQSLAAYRAGKHGDARKLALSAYLDGFELSEASLSNVSKPLMLETEKAMMNYRAGISDGVSPDELQDRYNRAAGLLDDARSALSGESLSPSVAFTSSLIILLREGMEAILVLAAMLAFLVRTKRHEALRYLHFGWIVALGLGLLTWWFSSYLITITGSTREVTEGVTALVAAGILLYVGYWLHGNTSTQKWNQYLRGKMNEALGRKALWTIFLLSFLAVYREAFETVLFYQALWVQAGDQSHAVIAWGAALAAALLVLIVWLMSRFGLRIPLRQFFTISALLMIALAVIFAGKGVAALQEAGKISIYPISIPRIEILGIFPNAQGTALQGVIILGSISMALFQRRRRVRG